jgi:hypothetical protein
MGRGRVRLQPRTPDADAKTERRLPGGLDHGAARNGFTALCFDAAIPDRRSDLQGRMK